MKSYTPRPSQNSDSFQSVYSYDNVEAFCSRKITKRGIRVLRSRDTLDRQRPVVIKYVIINNNNIINNMECIYYN